MKGKIVLISTVVVAIVLIVVGIVVYFRNKDVANTTGNTDIVETFTSTNYNLTFNYPKTLGEVTVSYVSSPIPLETLTFKTSFLKVMYPNSENDGFGSTITSENVTTKDGKTCEVSVHISNLTGSTIDEYTVLGICNDLKGSSVDFVLNNVKTQADVDADKVILKQIISTLTFTF